MDTLDSLPYNSRLIALGTAALGCRRKNGTFRFKIGSPHTSSEMEFSFISLFYNLQPGKLTLARKKQLDFRAFSLCDCLFEPEESGVCFSHQF